MENMEDFYVSHNYTQRLPPPFFFKYGKMICFYNVTQVTLHFKRWISTLWLLLLILWGKTRTWSTTQHIRKHPKKRAGNPIFRLCMRAPEGPPKGHVISGQNTRKKGGKSNFRLHMRALEGTLSGSRHFW
jgi:hypothetical protein